MIKTTLTRKSRSIRTSRFVTTLASAVVLMTSVHGTPLPPPTDSDPNIQFLNYVVNAAVPGKDFFSASSGDVKKGLDLAMSGNLDPSHTLTAANAVSIMATIAAARGNIAAPMAQDVLETLSDNSTANANIADDLAFVIAENAPKYANSAVGSLIKVIMKNSAIQGMYPTLPLLVTGTAVSGAPSYSGGILKNSLAAVKTAAPTLTSSLVTSALAPLGSAQVSSALKGGVGGNSALIGDQFQGAFLSSAGSSQVALCAGSLAAGAPKALSTLTSAIATYGASAAISASGSLQSQACVDLVNDMKSTSSDQPQDVTDALATAAGSTLAGRNAILGTASLVSAGKASLFTLSAVTGWESDAATLVTTAVNSAPSNAPKIAAKALEDSAIVTGGYFDDVAYAAAAANTNKAGDIVKEMLKVKSSGVYVLSTAQKKTVISSVLLPFSSQAGLVAVGIVGTGKDFEDSDFGRFGLNLLATSGSTNGDVAAFAAGLFKSNKNLRSTGTVSNLKSGLTGADASNVDIALSVVNAILVSDTVQVKPAVRVYTQMALSGSTAQAQTAVADAALVAAPKEPIAVMAAAIAAVTGSGSSLTATGTAIYNRAYAMYAIGTKAANYEQAWGTIKDVVGGNSAQSGLVRNLVYFRSREAINNAGGVISDITTAATQVAWKRTSEIVDGVVSGQPKQGKYAIGSAMRNVMIFDRFMAGDFTGITNAGSEYVSPSVTTPAGGGPQVDTQARVAAALVGTAVSAAIDALASKDEASAVKNILVGAVKEAINEFSKVKDPNYTELQQVRGSTAGTVLGIDTTVGNSSADTLLTMIATEAFKATKSTYAYDIANAIAIVLGYRNDWTLARQNAIVSALGGSAAATNGFNAGLALGNAERTGPTTVGTLAALIREHNSGHGPANFPITDISGL